MKSLRKWWRKTSGWAIAGMAVALLLVLGAIGTVAVMFFPGLAAPAGSGGAMVRPATPPGRGGWITWDDISGAYVSNTTQEQRNALANWWGNLWPR